jgi:hypothetical protein
MNLDQGIKIRDLAFLGDNLNLSASGLIFQLDSRKIGGGDGRAAHYKYDRWSSHFSISFSMFFYW